MDWITHVKDIDGACFSPSPLLESLNPLSLASKDCFPREGSCRQLGSYGLREIVQQGKLLEILRQGAAGGQCVSRKLHQPEWRHVPCVQGQHLQSVRCVLPWKGSMSLVWCGRSCLGVLVVTNLCWCVLFCFALFGVACLFLVYFGAMQPGNLITTNV